MASIFQQLIDSLPQVLYKKKYPEKFGKTHMKTFELASLVNKLAGLQPATSLRKRLRYSCFPLKTAKSFFAEHLQANTSNESNPADMCLKLLLENFL